MERVKRSLLALMLLLLVLLTGCGSVVEVRVVTSTVTPVVSPPTLTPGITAQLTTAPNSTFTSVVTVPTSTPIPQATSTPTSTAAPPTATPKPPTPTTQPTPTRIQFQPGETSATVRGGLADRQTDRYVVRALAGQTMEVTITSPSSNVLLSIVGADGVLLKSYVAGGVYWRGALPATQDYFIEALSIGGTTTYELAVWISPLEAEPIRIQFVSGATSATVTGRIRRTQPEGVEFAQKYVLRALAGQTMEVKITSPTNDVLLQIVGADGVPLKRYVDGSAQWRGQLTATQDYFIQPVSVGGDTTYELTVWISPLSEPEPIRVQFAPGATSATVEGGLESGTSDRYVLRALRGQRMEVSVRVSPAATVEITVEGQDGSFWSGLSSAGPLIITSLPATQDYVITLALPVPVAGSIGYTMEVRIPPP